MSRWARKRDEGHQEIRDGLRKCGIWVADTADCPGFVDLVACRRNNGLPPLEVFRDRMLLEAEEGLFLTPAECAILCAAIGSARPALAGQFTPLEVKREKGARGGGGGSLTEAQEKLIASCPGEIHVVRTLDEALEAIGARRR